MKYMKVYIHIAPPTIKGNWSVLDMLLSWLCPCLHEVLDLIPRQRKKVHLGLIFANWHICTVKTWQRVLSGDVLKSALCSTLKRSLKVLEFFFFNRNGLYNFHQYNKDFLAEICVVVEFFTFVNLVPFQLIWFSVETSVKLVESFLNSTRHVSPFFFSRFYYIY